MAFLGLQQRRMGSVILLYETDSCLGRRGRSRPRPLLDLPWGPWGALVCAQVSRLVSAASLSWKDLQKYLFPKLKDVWGGFSLLQKKVKSENGIACLFGSQSSGRRCPPRASRDPLSIVPLAARLWTAVPRHLCFVPPSVFCVSISRLCPEVSARPKRLFLGCGNPQKISI